MGRAERAPDVVERRSGRGDRGEFVQIWGRPYISSNIQVQLWPGISLMFGYGLIGRFPTLAGFLVENSKSVRTLHRIHTYVEAQQDTSQIRQFFCKGEMKNLLKACHAGLQDSLEVFEVQNIRLHTAIADIQKYEEERHQEVLQMIETFSDDDSKPDRASSLNLNLHAPVSAQDIPWS
ncbi:hypothetical protein C8R43DRAFT_961228 [Mycena crocata]|nr:hypothetical protein C8R43DRAFT_961228 [Mycena crocata]